MSWFRRRGAFDNASQVTAKTGDRWLDSLLSQVDATLDKPADALTSTVLAQRVGELATRRSHKRLDDQRAPDQRPLSEDTKVPSKSGPLATRVMGYRTRDGLTDYGFSIEFHPHVGWRVYIVFAPFRRGHSGSLELPYQSVEDGRRYVDWPAKIDILDDARTVARLWAELTQRYQSAEEESALWAELTERH